MEAIVLAMGKKDTENRGFFRAGADLVVIVLTNEDEGSNGKAPDLVHPSTVVAAAKTIFGLNKSFTGFGLYIKPGDTNCYNAMKNVDPPMTVATIAACEGANTAEMAANINTKPK